MAPEEQGSLGNPHLKISVGVSALTSLVAVILTWGITWGVYSQRLQNQEDNAAHAADVIEANTRLNAAQESKLAVMSSQYAEIIRRLEKIDRKLEP